MTATAEHAGTTAAGAETAPLLAVEGASVSFGRRRALRGVSLTIAPGEIVVLLGPNGAGKSTLVRATAGRLGLEAGTVRVAGRDPAGDRAVRRLIGIVPQQVALFEQLTAAENLAAFGRLMGLGARDARKRARELLGEVGLAERAGDRVSQLSGGMRRRVNIAAGLMHGPRLLILDEPTVGVDLKARAGLAQLLRELKARGLAIMLTTHDLDEAESLADRVAIIVAGRIEDEGEPERLVERLFGTRREVSIGLGSAIGRRTADELARGLAAGGLVPQGDGRLWQGVVDASADALDGLVRLSFESGGAIEDVRVRRPGLAAVLTEYVRRSAGTDEREG